MTTPKITFNIGSGGLGRPLANNDHISGLLFFNDTLPSGFASDDRIKVCYSLEDAEGFGIAEGSVNHRVEHYQIKSFFQQNPKGKLYVGIYALALQPYNFEELAMMQSFANGEIRQFGVTDLSADTVTRIGTDDVHDAIQTVVDGLKAIDQSVSVLVGFDDTSIANTDYATLTAESAPNVSVVIGQDGAGAGSVVATANSTSMPAVGHFLGAVSLASVHENIGWVGKFNLSQTDDLSVPALNSGEKYSDISVALEDSLNTMGYLFLKNHVGTSGTFANYSWTAVSQSDDFSTIEKNRTMDKAVRNVKTFMLPNINAPVDLNDDGTLTENSISLFKNAAERGLDLMEQAGEISAKSVAIDPTQNTGSTSNVTISIAIVPVGVAQTITINIGFAVSV